MELKTKAYALLVLTLFSGALIPVLLVFAKGVNLYEFFLMLYGVSVPVSIAFVLYRGRLGELVASVKNPRRLALLCFIGIVTYLPIEFGMAFAEKYVSASLATAVFRLSPLLMLLLLPTLLKERLSRYQIAALSFAFVGLFIGISAGNPLAIFQNSNVGIVIFLIAMAFMYALSVIMIKKYIIDIGVLVAVASATMFVIFLALFVLGGMQIQALNTAQIAVLMYIGIVFNVFSFFLYLTALRPIKATIVSNVYAFSPFITFVLAYIMLGENIQPYYIAIALLAGVGIALQGFDKYGGRYIAINKDSSINHMTIFDVTGIFADTGEVAINSAIRGGGRVLAVKLGAEHAKNLDSIINANEYGGVYTDTHKSVRNESKFVKSVLGARDDDVVVMKSGRLEECERFFANLHSKLGLKEGC